MQVLNKKFEKNFTAINIGSGQKLSSIYIAQIIINELNSFSKIKLVEKNPALGNFVFNIEKAKKILDFNPGNLSFFIKEYTKTFKIYSNTK